MSPEQQRIAILTRLGWTKLRNHEVKTKKQPDGEIKTTSGPWHALWGTDPQGREGRYAPNPLKSLDACAAMEAKLSNVEYRIYVERLNEIVSRENTYRVVGASAPQRCEAFLRVKGIIP